MTVNYFRKYEGQLLVVIYDGDVADVAPFGPPNADSLIRASSMARDWSLMTGVDKAIIWAPDETMVTQFRKGLVVDPVPNPRAGIQ